MLKKKVNIKENQQQKEAYRCWQTIALPPNPANTSFNVGHALKIVFTFLNIWREKFERKIFCDT